MNPRVLHILCGGYNVGKTTFARYLQVGKKKVRRICMEELTYSIGLNPKNDDFFFAMVMMLLDGDVIIDGVDNNTRVQRMRVLKGLDRLRANFRAFAYVIKRPPEHCHDEYHSEDEVIFSQYEVEYPDIREGFDRIMTVTWEDSTEFLRYGEESLLIKPKIVVVSEIPSSKPVIVKPKKGMVKRKLERGRQNLFRPKRTRND